MNLDGKVALITGAASGLGYAIAKRYLEADGRVALFLAAFETNALTGQSICLSHGWHMS